MRSDIVNKLIWLLAESENPKHVIYTTPKYKYHMIVIEDHPGYLRCDIIKEEKEGRDSEIQTVKIGKSLLEKRRESLYD